MRQRGVRRSYFSRISDYIGKPLREQCDDIAHEPLPERWVDFINYLNAQEQQQAEVRPRAKRQPPLPH